MKRMIIIDDRIYKLDKVSNSIFVMQSKILTCIAKTIRSNLRARAER